MNIKDKEKKEPVAVIDGSGFDGWLTFWQFGAGTGTIVLILFLIINKLIGTGEF